MSVSNYRYYAFYPFWAEPSSPDKGTALAFCSWVFYPCVILVTILVWVHTDERIGCLHPLFIFAGLLLIVPIFAGVLRVFYLAWLLVFLASINCGIIFTVFSDGRIWWGSSKAWYSLLSFTGSVMLINSFSFFWYCLFIGNFINFISCLAIILIYKNNNWLSWGERKMLPDNIEEKLKKLARWNYIVT